MSLTLPKELFNHLGERLDFAVHKGDPRRDTIVLIGHGVTGNKDRPHLVHLAETLAAQGTTALRFSFAGNGQSEGRFEDSTVLKQVEELGAIISALGDARIAYIGHSLGGAVGTLRASGDDRIAFLGSLAGMAHTRAFVTREFGQVKPGAGCMWDEPDYPLSAAFVRAMDQANVVDAARRVTVPWLFVHGLADDVVPAQDSRDLCAVAAGPTTLQLIDGADHLFSEGKQPVMSQAVVDWLQLLDKR